MANQKLLLILHHSPPVHGAAKVGDTILASELLKNVFKTRFIKIKSSESLESIGKFDFKKIGDTFRLFLKTCFQLTFFRPQKIYFTVSPYGFAFYRDLFISVPIKIYTTLTTCKVFYHYHARGIAAFTSKSTLNKKLTNFFVHNVNMIFISKMMASELVDLTSYKQQFFLKNGVENTIDTNNFETILNTRFKSKNINVLYLSNMMKEKGYDTVLELAKKVKEKNIKAEFNFAGAWASKEDELYFNKFVKENGLETIVNYHGLVSGEEKKNVFKNANLFIFPSRYSKEVFPLSLLEALSYGLPILTFDIGAVADIIDNEIGAVTNSDFIFESFQKMKKQYLNKDVSLICRKRFLENYTTKVFEKNLTAILKLKDEH